MFLPRTSSIFGVKARVSSRRDDVQTEGIGVPVVFSVVTDPVGAGIVDSMQHPGGHITGVVFGIQEARRLEWLVRIAPDIRQIYVPFNPKDQSPVLALKMLCNAAAKLGVKLITREVHGPETLNDAVFNIPAEADAVFFLPDSSIATQLPDLVTTANKRNLPTSAANISMAFGLQGLESLSDGRMTDADIGGRPTQAGGPALPVDSLLEIVQTNLRTGAL